jgi:sarcosine oxidase
MASAGRAVSGTWDVIVVGVGAMGSAVAHHAAARGLRVLALEQFTLGHTRGSSHGLTRIIRLAYFEHPAYVPLLRRAFALWRALEADTGTSLLHVTGALDVGWAGSPVFEGSRRSCEAHGLTHEVLDADALARRVPAWRPTDDACAVWQPDGGFLTPERAIAANVAQARAYGADVREGVTVRGWSAHEGTVMVSTDAGVFSAGQLVLSAGAWMGDLHPALASRLTPERQVLGWFAIAPDARTDFAPANFPVFVLEAREGLYYGFPEFDVPGFKIGRYHHLGEVVHPDDAPRACDARDEMALRDAVARWFPGANGPLQRSATCLFTNTSDGHFLIDRAPDAPEVLLVSPCSGHGFKFASVIGEVAADLLTDGRTAHDVALFRRDRLFAPTRG